MLTVPPQAVRALNLTTNFSAGPAARLIGPPPFLSRRLLLSVNHFCSLLLFLLSLRSFPSFWLGQRPGLFFFLRPGDWFLFTGTFIAVSLVSHSSFSFSVYPTAASLFFLFLLKGTSFLHNDPLFTFRSCSFPVQLTSLSQPPSVCLIVQQFVSFLSSVHCLMCLFYFHFVF